MSERTSHARPRFLELGGRRLFALDIVPTGTRRGALLYLPPFTEEMNRCRAHAAKQARALAALGYRCLLLDYHGTGESGGSTLEGDWDLWLDDAKRAARWLADDSALPLTVWGVRTGALLAARLAAAREVAVERLLFWQPVLDGKLFLNQHLRLRIATQIVHAEARETTESIRERLRGGETLEVGGYPLTPALAEGLAAMRLADHLAAPGPRIDWIEMVGPSDTGLALPSQRAVEQIRGVGVEVATAVAVCPKIWQLQVPESAPDLIATTSRLMGAQA
ncbi:MAG: hydrolase 2, exosortase A system-associated [Burkholderiales bacterium]|nr:hydrolase 2, exosortase A system-associated [Burkholderiales bacterium]